MNHFSAKYFVPVMFCFAAGVLVPSAAFANRARRVLLEINLTQNSSAQDIAKITAAATKSLMIDKWVGSCVLTSYFDTAEFSEEANEMNVTMVAKMDRHGEADCSEENKWVETQTSNLLETAGVKLVSVLSDEDDGNVKP